VKSTNLEKFQLIVPSLMMHCLPVNGEREREERRRSKVSCGWLRRYARDEGEIWYSSRTSSAHLLLYEKSTRMFL
jgi:hypothetical protein